MSDGRKYYCFCEANCKFETMTKEQILAAIAQAAEHGLVFDADAAFITKVKESNAGNNLTFWLGTQAQYNALVINGKKDPNCFYVLTDCDSPAELTQKVKELQNKLATLTAADVGARPNTWLPTIAEIGAAPAGYGLGGATKVVDHWDNATESGFYASASGLPAGADGSMHQGIVYRYNGWIYQDVKKTGTNESYALTRKKVENGDWQPWEYINPPMIPGIEYRTTERYCGLPVYTKLVDISDISTQGASVNFGNVGIIRHVSRVKMLEYDAVFVAPYPVDRDGNECHTYSEQSTIYFEGSGGFAKSTEWVVQAWYFKQ